MIPSSCKLQLNTLKQHQTVHFCKRCKNVWTQTYPQSLFYQAVWFGNSTNHCKALGISKIFRAKKSIKILLFFLIGHFIGFHCICPIASKIVSIPFICTCHYLHVLLVVCSNPEKVDCIRINTLVFGLLQYSGFECYNCTSCIVARLDLVVSTSQIGFFSWRFTRFERQRIYETNKNPVDSSG